MTATVVQLLTISDDVCKDYIYKMIETREFLTFAEAATSQIASIFTAFGVVDATITKITNVATGVRSIATGYFLTEQLVNEKFSTMISERDIFRTMILMAWEGNRAKTKKEIIEEPYSVLQLLIDIDRYHKSCSFYDQVYLAGKGSNINTRSKMYFAHHQLESNTTTSALLKSLLGQS